MKEFCTVWKKEYSTPLEENYAEAYEFRNNHFMKKRDITLQNHN